MASFKTNEAARLNRLASMTDTRPEPDAPAPASSGMSVISPTPSFWAA